MYRIIQYIDRALSKCAKLLFCTQMRALVEETQVLRRNSSFNILPIIPKWNTHRLMLFNPNFQESL